MRWRMLFLLLAFLVTAWVGNAAIAAFTEFAIGEPISLVELASHLPFVRPVDAWNAAGGDFAVIANSVTAVTFVAAVFATLVRHRFALILGWLATAAALPVAAIGAFLLADGATQGRDVAWLLEGFPAFEVFVLWYFFLCCYMAALHWSWPQRRQHY